MRRGGVLNLLRAGFTNCEALDGNSVYGDGSLVRSSNICGGAVHVSRAGTLQAEEAFFQNSQAPQGGALCLDGIATANDDNGDDSVDYYDKNNNTAVAVLTDTSFVACRALHGGGGAISVSGGAHLSLHGQFFVSIGCTSDSIHSTSQGGAIYVRDAGSILESTESTTLLLLGSLGSHSDGLSTTTSLRWLLGTAAAAARTGFYESLWIA